MIRMLSVVDLLMNNSYLIMGMDHSVGPREWRPQCSRSVVTLTWCGPESCVYQANDGDAMPGLLCRTEEFKPMTTHKRWIEYYAI